MPLCRLFGSFGARRIHRRRGLIRQRFGQAAFEQFHNEGALMAVGTSKCELLDCSPDACRKEM